MCLYEEIYFRNQPCAVLGAVWLPLTDLLLHTWNLKFIRRSGREDVGGHQERDIKSTREPAIVIGGLWEQTDTEIHQFQWPLTLDDTDGLQKLGGFVVEFNMFTPRVGVEGAEGRARQGGEAAGVDVASCQQGEPSDEWQHVDYKQMLFQSWPQELSQESLLGTHPNKRDRGRRNVGNTQGLPVSQATQCWHREQNFPLKPEALYTAAILEALSSLSPELGNTR